MKFCEICGTRLSREHIGELCNRCDRKNNGTNWQKNHGSNEIKQNVSEPPRYYRDDQGRIRKASSQDESDEQKDSPKQIEKKSAPTYKPLLPFLEDIAQYRRNQIKNPNVQCSIKFCS